MRIVGVWWCMDGHGSDGGADFFVVWLIHGAATGIVTFTGTHTATFTGSGIARDYGWNAILLLLLLLLVVVRWLKLFVVLRWWERK